MAIAMAALLTGGTIWFAGALVYVAWLGWTKRELPEWLRDD